MIFNDKKIAFPAIPKISFAKIFDTYQSLVDDPDTNIANYSKNLLKIKKDFPALYDGFEDFEEVNKYNKEIDMLMRTLFPTALTNNEIKAVMPPFSFYPLHTSARFKKIMEAAGKDFQVEMKGYDEESLYIYGCAAILRMHYNYPINTASRTLLEIPDKNSKLIKTYRQTFNADMIEMIPTNKAVDITYDDYLELMADFENLELWKKKFPPRSWIMRGIGIANLIDVTTDTAVADITQNLIIKSPDSLENIKNSIRRLFNIHDLQVGLISFEGNTFYNTHKEKMSSITLQQNQELKCADTLCNWSYDQLIEKNKPLIVTDVEKFFDKNKSLLGKLLQQSGIKSYIIVPLIHEEEVLGFLEIGSEKKYVLNNSLSNKLLLVTPIISMAASRFKNEMKNNIEAIIQQECTTIHPSVKWRFEEEANKYLTQKEQNEDATFKDLIFKDVIPLYGQLDIRESSVKRNVAVKHDLEKQLREIHKILRSVYDQLKMPVYEELLFEIEGFKKELKGDLHAGIEHKILSFLSSEIYPLFVHFEGMGPDIKKLVNSYQGKLDAQLGSIYEERKKFDESVMKVNYSLASIIDEKQLEAQKMFPHYFERYKTDGIEYNMYIGQSITKNKKYDSIYLKNLQLWQLTTMCEMEIQFQQIRSELSCPLDIASLILVYNTPLAVHFRMDEKRFDVEGAYNARYEIVKKRIDKANIKGTNERITVPGKITIVYSRDQDIIDYQKFISYLQSKGLLKNKKVEDHPLEDLQGITGLRALRVEVNYDIGKKVKGDLKVEEFIKALESQN